MARSSTHAELPTPSPPPPGTERAKVLSVRLSADEFERLTDLATEIGVGPSTLARTLIRRGMAPTNTAVEAVTSPLEQAHLERTHGGSDQDTGTLEELTARITALEAWVASHPAHHAT